MDGIVQVLLMLLTGAVIFNILVSFYFWFKDRSKLNLSLFLVWLTLIISFFAQGIVSDNLTLSIVTFGLTVFLNNLALAFLVHCLIDEPLKMRRYILFISLSFLWFIFAYILGLSFFLQSIVVALAASYPLLDSAIKSKAHWKKLTTSSKILTFITILYYLHTLDYALLRANPQGAVFGFTIAYIVIYALSVFGPAVILEKTTYEKVKISAEISLAQSIQNQILPKTLAFDGYEIDTYFNAADEIGGDFYDFYKKDDNLWVFIGDVTGHGIGSGLVMFMTQSILNSILSIYPDITPKKLNFLANLILFQNLERLDEVRPTTIVSTKICTNKVCFSGSHDSIFVFNYNSNKVQLFEANHFPLGLGFMPDISESDISESEIIMNKGDFIFLGTDGITECFENGDYNKSQFGENRLISFLEENGRKPIGEIKSMLINRLNEFTNSTFYDDVTFLILKSSL